MPQIQEIQILQAISDFNAELIELQKAKDAVAADLAHTKEKQRPLYTGPDRPKYLNYKMKKEYDAGLAKKRSELEEQLMLVNKQIVELNQVIDEHKQELDRVQTQNYVAEFKQAGGTLMSEIEDSLTEPINGSQQQKNIIYACADRALLVSQSLDSDQHNYELIQCWRMANLARAVAVADFKHDPKNQDFVVQKAKYFVGAKNMFAKLIQVLPPEMQLLKVLYTIGDFAAIDDYLYEYSVQSEEIARPGSASTDSTTLSSRSGVAKGNSAEFGDLITRMAEIVDVASKNYARKSLEKRSNFVALPDDVKEELIRQRAYVLRLRSFVYFGDMDPKDPLREELYALSTRLNDNIDAAILNNRTINQKDNDFAEVQQQIMTRETAMMQQIFKLRVGDRISTFVGGTGLTAWLLGVGLLPAATLAAAGVVAAASYEATQLMQGVETTESKKLAGEIDPVDYEYLMQIDKIWEAFSGTPISKAQVSGDTLAAHLAKKGMERVWKDLEPMHDQKVTEPLLEKVWETAAPYTNKAFNWGVALFTITIASLVANLIILTIIFSPVWPTWIALAVLAILGLGIAQVIVPGTKISEKIMRMASAMTFNVALTFNLLLSPWRALTSNMKQGRYFRGAISLIVGVLLGFVAVALVPGIAPLMAINAIIGGLAGAYLGLGVREIVNKIFTKPLDIIRSMNKATTVVQENEISFTKVEVERLNHLDPKFGEKLSSYFQNRIRQLKLEISRLGVSTDQEQAKNLAAKVSELEIKWVETKGLIRQLLIMDASEQEQGIDVLCRYLDDYFFTKYAVARDSFIERAKTRVQQRMQSKEPLHVAQVEPAPPGMTPAFGKMKFAVDYKADRAELDELADLESIVNKIKINVAQRHE